jgi:hypothetical protein
MIEHTVIRGKCDACRKVYAWAAAPLLRDALCPVHKTPLRRTSYLHRFPVVREQPKTALRDAAGKALVLS